MNQTQTKDLPFVFPDPITHINQLSAACFLYFESPLVLTMPPDVITTEAFQVQELIKARRPAWASAYFGIVAEWLQEKRGCNLTLELLEPLSANGRFKTVYLGYAANGGALERAGDLIASSGLPDDQIESMVRFPAACSELVRHIHLERYLELEKDINQLYAYCDEIFQPVNLASILLRSYFFRPSSLRLQDSRPSFLLTNPRLIELFAGVPVEATVSNDARANLIDMAGWEIFRRLISPRLDPMTPDDVSMVLEIHKNGKNELNKMKSHCISLAEEIDLSAKASAIVEQIDRLVRLKVSHEISELLALDQKGLRTFLTEVFSDEKTWLACAAGLTGLLTGTSPLTAGAAIVALSSVGAKALKVAADRKEKLRESNLP